MNRQRRQLAVTAARLLSEEGIRDYRQARRKAAERLGIRDDPSPACHEEIAAAVREHQRLFQGGNQPQWLRQRRAAAVEAMEFFAPFSPRLVGAVLDGSADEFSAVCLHLFNDSPEAVLEYLRDHGIPVEQTARRLRLDHRHWAPFPAFLFNAEGIPFDLTVLPWDHLRQAPRDSVTGKPMQRATREQVMQLLQ